VLLLLTVLPHLGLLQKVGLRCCHGGGGGPGRGVQAGRRHERGGAAGRVRG
jgi:hypothetical protein